MQMRAIAYLLLAMLLFAIQDSIFKHLAETYAVSQLLFARMSLVVVVLFAVYLKRRHSLPLYTSHWPLMFLRGIAAYFAFTLYYLALQRVPLAEAATLLMTAPLFITALSVPLLGERVGWHRWAAVCTGFLAVIAMLRPGLELFQLVMLVPLLSAVVYSLIPIITRTIDTNVGTFCITFYTVLAYWILTAVASVAIHLIPVSPDSSVIFIAFAQPWSALTLTAFFKIAITAVIFCVSILLVTSAYRHAQASAITSFEYVYLVWAVVIGYLFFDEIPSRLTMTAALVIIACGVYITWREHRNLKQMAVVANNLSV